MSTSRDRMLARLRAGLGESRPFLAAEAAASPHAPPPFVHPAFAGEQTPGAEPDLAEQFAAELSKLQAYPHLCADAEAALRSALEVLEPLRASAPNQYWEPFALLTRVACANRSSDCEALRRGAREAQARSLAAGTQARLRAALDQP